MADNFNASNEKQKVGFIKIEEGVSENVVFQTGMAKSNSLF